MILSSYFDDSFPSIDCVPLILLFLQAQNQACEQSMVEAEMDFKKMIDHISETRDTMEVCFAVTFQPFFSIQT